MRRGAIARRAVLLLAVVVCLSALGAGTAAAENVTITNPTEGEIGDHTWNTTVTSSGTYQLEYLVINYTGTGADLSGNNVKIEGDSIVANGTNVAINGSKYSRTSATVNATIESGQSVLISNGDRIEFTLRNVNNPSATGTYDPSVELNNTSSNFASSTESFEIVQGGYVNGTIKDQTGTALTSGSVTILNNSTDASVTTYGVDGSGQYTAHIPDGNYSFRYTAN